MSRGSVKVKLIIELWNWNINCKLWTITIINLPNRTFPLNYSQGHHRISFLPFKTQEIRAVPFFFFFFYKNPGPYFFLPFLFETEIHFLINILISFSHEQERSIRKQFPNCSSSLCTEARSWAEENGMKMNDSEERRVSVEEVGTYFSYHKTWS